jgi:hypothetical protein
MGEKRAADNSGEGVLTRENDARTMAIGQRMAELRVPVPKGRRIVIHAFLLILDVAAIALFVLHIVLLVWIARDAQARGMSGIGWIFLAPNGFLSLGC